MGPTPSWDRAASDPRPGGLWLPTPRRIRSRQWERILGGRAAVSFFDPGGCGCPSPACFGTCSLPATNLTATITARVPGAQTGSGTLAYSPSSGPYGSPQWSACILLSSGTAYCKALIGVIPAALSGLGSNCCYALFNIPIGSCLTSSWDYLWESTAGCSGFSASNPTSLLSYSCSPLSITWGNISFENFVVTP